MTIHFLSKLYLSATITKNFNKIRSDFLTRLAEKKLDLSEQLKVIFSVIQDFKDTQNKEVCKLASR